MSPKDLVQLVLHLLSLQFLEVLWAHGVLVLNRASLPLIYRQECTQDLV